MELIPFDQIQSMATVVAKAGCFGFKSPEQAAALMLVAQADGLHPAKAATHYHIIQGRPSLTADAMLARFQQAGGRVEWGQYSDESVTGTFTHAQGGSVSITWTIPRAKKAGVGNLDKYPAAMLRARCISEGVRTVYPGVIVGLYTPEEVIDFAPQSVPVEVTQHAAPVEVVAQVEVITAPEPFNNCQTMTDLVTAFKAATINIDPESQQYQTLRQAAVNRKAQLK